MPNISSKNIPLSFKPILWSYNFNKLNPQKDKKLIIIQAINYGDLYHWQWLAKHYGRKEVQKIVSQVPITEIRPRVRKLVSLLFSIPEKEFNYAPRSSK